MARHRLTFNLRVLLTTLYVFGLTLCDATSVNMTFHPATESSVIRDESVVIGVNISVVFDQSSCGYCSNSSWTLQITSSDAAIAVVTPPTDQQQLDITGDTGVNSGGVTWVRNFTVRGVQLGRATVTTSLDSSSPAAGDGRLTHDVGEYRLRVLRTEPPISQETISIVVAVVVAVAQFLFAIALDLEEIKQHVKRPKLLVLGFLCQYLLMPPVGVATDCLKIMLKGLNDRLLHITMFMSLFAKIIRFRYIKVYTDK